ncbi:hypothetical protein CBR_g31811 [Chara braunii]|uniref:Uncharacterized protein n=1 Tax=Chara braunii TaxID=69332 RepID=A0A388LFP9_CHABU|nr:hypothetical protein CBR_g31811 [Chara braunii]|eukprot:GBG81135.1 hypothetical protein CBR_g31811 [Chara braunii]
MLLPIEFLSKTNGYRKSGQFPTVAAGHHITLPLVPFDAPVESLAGLSTCSSDHRQVVSTPQQPVGGKDEVITYQRRSGGGSSGNLPKKKGLAIPPSDLFGSSRVGASSRLRDTAQRGMDEESEEDTEEDERVRQLHSRLLATPRHIQGEGSCDVNVGREAAGGAEALVRDDEEYNKHEGECGSGERREQVRGAVDHMEWEKVAASGGVGDGSVGGSEMQDEELEAEGGDAGHARRKAVDEARVALNASQGTKGEADVKCKSSTRNRKTSQPKKPVRPSRRQKWDDSSDDAEGVAPRLLSLPDDEEQETKKPSAVNMTQCFFLEYDEDGKKRRDPPRVVIDVMQILRIPVGDIAFNQRSMNPAIVHGIEAVIEASTRPRSEDDPAPWDPPELVLAPIKPSKDINEQGIRVLPEEFDPDRADEYLYYPVVGQHTSEAMKRAVAKKSAAVEVFGFRNYDRVRIIYFDDDHKNGYAFVSIYDNTRGDRAMLPSFHYACEDIRGFWDSQERIGPVGNVSKGDPKGLSHQKTWREFLKSCMGKSCEKSLWTESLVPKWQQDWTNRMSGYMNVATCKNRIWSLVKEFFEKFEAGELLLHDNKCPKDLLGKQEGRVPGQFTEEVQGKKEVFRCIPAMDGGPNATVSFKDLVPSNFKCFGDMTTREKEIALRLMINKKVIVTTRLVPPGKLNMTNLLNIIMRERYMMRLFNYIIFKSENREAKEWKDGNLFDYEKVEERFGAKAAEWDEESDRIPLEYVRRVPKRLDGEHEEKYQKGAGLKATAALYRDAPFHFKYFVYHAIGRVNLLTAELRLLKNAALNLSWEKKQRRSTLLPVNMHPKELLPAADEIVTAIVMKQLYNWDDAEVIPGTWKRFLAVGTTVSKYENWQVDYKDTMVVVLYAEGGNLKKVTRAPKSEAELVELNVEEEQFKRCIARHGGEEENEREIYGWWERHPKRLQSSFLHEDQGVILIGKSYARLVWELLRAGHHVFSCDSSLKDISYLTKAIEILWKDARNDCKVERQKTAHRPDRDMYHKLGKKRNKMWEYLFQGQSKSPFEHDYIVRKAMTQEAYGGYHKAQVGAFAMFVARCEQMKFTTNQAMLTYDEYSNIAKTNDAWNPIESDEETETSDLEIEERVKRLREEVQSVPACSVPNKNPKESHTKSRGASSPTRDVTDRASSIEEMQTDSPMSLQALDNTLIHGNRHGFQGRPHTLGGNTEQNMLADDDEDDLAVLDTLPRLKPGDDVPDRIVQVSEQPYLIEDKVPETASEKWGHHILWHTNVFESCIVNGEWMMALHLASRWKVKPRLAEVPWLKLAKSEIVFCVRKENEGASEAAIEEKAQLLFDYLHSENQLEYKHKFYDLSSSRSYNDINWKIELLSEGQGIETIQLGCSQLGGQSTTHFAASVGEAMSQTAVKIMGVDKGTQNVDNDPSNVASYGPPLLTQAENQSVSQMESPTPSTNMAVSNGMQGGGYAECVTELQNDSDEMMKVLEEAEKEAKRKDEGSTTS